MKSDEWLFSFILKFIHTKYKTRKEKDCSFGRNSIVYTGHERRNEKQNHHRRMFVVWRNNKKRKNDSSVVPHELVKYQAVDFDGQALTDNYSMNSVAEKEKKK